jgi:hypothetical protein
VKVWKQSTPVVGAQECTIRIWESRTHRDWRLTDWTYNGMNWFNLAPYYMGCFYLVVMTVLRYRDLSRFSLPKIKRLKASLSAVGIKQRSPDVFPMLGQITGFVYLFIGLIYNNLITGPVSNNRLFNFIIDLVVGFGPGLLFLVAIKLLQVKYWNRPS